jgi:hypothetical protein
VSYVELSTVDAMKRWWIPAAALAVLVMVGCSKEEPTQPSQPKNYMPLAVGNWWVYSRVELDTNGNEKRGTEWRDSTVVVDTVRIAGKTAYALAIYRGGGAVDTTYMALEGNKLYMYMDTSEDVRDNPFRVFGPWMLMVDFSGQSWSTQDSVRLDSMELFGYRGTFIGVAQLSGRRVGSEARQIRERGQTVQAEKFELTLNYIGNFEAQGIRIPRLQYEIRVAMWFAENIGQVSDRTGPGSMNIQLPPPLPPRQMKFEGEAGELLNYQVR